MSSQRHRRQSEPKSSALDLLRFVADGPAECVPTDKGRFALIRSNAVRNLSHELLEKLIAADLLHVADGKISLTDAGCAHLKRTMAPTEPFLAQHGRVVQREKTRGDPIDAILVNEAESPLVWLARRRTRDGRSLVDAAQLAAGERLRADFTRAGLTPRVTANWIAPVAQARRGATGEEATVFANSVLAAKARLNRALEAVGPEFAGLLLDVCCFLKRLETVERERGWPLRAAKVVLGLALDRLARHYGIALEAKGPARARTRAWQAPGARPTIDGS
jgi:hypothetical protein